MVGLGAGLGIGHSYKFIRIVQLVKYVRFGKSYEFVRVRSYVVRISHLVKYVRIGLEIRLKVHIDYMLQKALTNTSNTS